MIQEVIHKKKKRQKCLLIKKNKFIFCKKVKLILELFPVFKFFNVFIVLSTFCTFLIILNLDKYKHE